MKTPITRQRIRHHLTYCGWMYILLVIAASFGWNLIYTTTEPRIPPEERLTFYVTATANSDQPLEDFMQKAWETQFPELKEVEHITVLGSSDRDYTGTVQLYTYLFSDQGDVYLLKREDFRSYAGPAVCVDLEAYVNDGTLKIPEGMSLNKGYITLGADFEEMAGERHLYGIPCAALPGFKDKLGIDPSDKYLIVTAYGGNQANALKFVQYLIDTLQ